MARRARLASRDPALVLAAPTVAWPGPPGRPRRPARGEVQAARQSSTTAPQHRRHPLGTRPAGIVTGTARGANPTEPADACPAAWPGRPCAPLLISARTSPARSAPGWAHRLGSPVLPIETPGLGHRSDSAGSQKLADSSTLGRNKKLSADLGTLEEYRQEVKSMNKMS